MNALLAVSLGYVALLFAVAFGAERLARRGRAGWMRGPLVYTLSLSVYCTAWTFYGAVGFAARAGLEYLTIYLGPTLVMIGWWWVLRKLVRIGRSQRITSIADLISARFGKSSLLAALVTGLAVIGTTPYIALQLQSVTLSYAAFTGGGPGVMGETALFIAAGLALFTVLFGTRNLDANERHHGVVMAIAVEAVVKLAALLAVGLFVVWGLTDGVGDMLARIDASPLANWEVRPDRWAGLTFLAGAAFLTLPRMFQVLVVENEDERHLLTASWAFPLYVLAMSLFVVPIAVIGLERLPEGSNPDLFVLSLPLSEGQTALAVFAFLGGFSSATSMVIVAAIAVSTMLSNHIVMPLWLRAQGAGASMSGDVRKAVLRARRVSIIVVVALGYLYFRLSGGGTALAAIGLVSFAGVAQILPAMLGGLFWRGATRAGAIAGLLTGFALWLYTLFLPSFGPGVMLGEALLAHGPWGLAPLRPQALFGLTGMDPLIHALLWSISLNAGVFCVVSLLSFPGPLERLQGAQFVNIFDHASAPRAWARGPAQSEDLLVMSQRILGSAEARALFEEAAAAQGAPGGLPDPSPEFLSLLERRLAGSVGAATAHAMVAQMTGGAAVSVEDLMAVADEAAQIMEHSSQLEAQSRELARTARELSAANAKLTQLSVQKDAFLAQISHELRTPMTSIRAFSEILRAPGDLSEAEMRRFAGIIHEEAQRLTRLLDELLDLSVLESGAVRVVPVAGQLSEVLTRAITAALGEGAPLVVTRMGDDLPVTTDLDRLTQVFINLIANAAKYCIAPEPRLTISTRQEGAWIVITFADNGAGIAPDLQGLLFEKFSRGGADQAGGAGLGLAISREVMHRLGGDLVYCVDCPGAVFEVYLPCAAP